MFFFEKNVYRTILYVLRAPNLLSECLENQVKRLYEDGSKGMDLRVRKVDVIQSLEYSRLLALTGGILRSELIQGGKSN